MRMYRASILWSLIGAVLLSTATAVAQAPGKEPAKRAPSESTLVVRTYPVGDILAAAPDYPYRGGVLPAIEPIPAPATWSGGAGKQAGTGNRMGGGMGGMGGMGAGMGGMGGGMGGMGGVGGMGMFQVAPENPAESAPHLETPNQASGQQQTPPKDSSRPANLLTMEQLIEAIITVIEPTTWSSVGGPGEITSFGTLLLVSQTPRVHEQITQLLTSIRDQGDTAQSVLVEAIWLQLDSSGLNKLLASAIEKGGVRVIDAKLLEDMIREVPSYRGQVTCFNRQTVHVVSGNRRLVAVSAIPVVGSLPGYQPIVAFPNLGVLLQVTPSLLPGSSAVILDVHSTVTQWQEPGKPLVVGGDYPPSTENTGTGVQPIPPARITAEVDRVNILTQELETTLRLPPGYPILVGGLTRDPATPVASTPEKQDGKQLYLVVRVTEQAGKR